MECLKHWLKNGWLDQLKVDLPDGQHIEEADGELNIKWSNGTPRCMSQDLENPESDMRLW